MGSGGAVKKYVFVVEISAETYLAAEKAFNSGQFSVPVGVDIVTGYMGELDTSSGKRVVVEPR